MAKLTAAQLEEQLPHFTGTEQWYKFNMLFRNMLLTDGTQFLAEKAGAYWLMELIGSHQTNPKVRREMFQNWTLKLNDKGGCRITCDDGNGNVLCRQDVPYTDFPMDIKLYCIWSVDEVNKPYAVILLPSEY